MKTIKSRVWTLKQVSLPPASLPHQSETIKSSISLCRKQHILIMIQFHSEEQSFVECLPTRWRPGMECCLNVGQNSCPYWALVWGSGKVFLLQHLWYGNIDFLDYASEIQEINTNMFPVLDMRYLILYVIKSIIVKGHRDGDSKKLSQWWVGYLQAMQKPGYHQDREKHPRYDNSPLVHPSWFLISTMFFPFRTQLFFIKRVNGKLWQWSCLELPRKHV